MANVLQKLNIDDLRKLQEILIHDKMALQKEIDLRNRIDSQRIYDCYRASAKQLRLEDMIQNKRREYDLAMQTIPFSSFHFFTRSMLQGKHNNKGSLREYDLLMMDNEFREVAKSYGISSSAKLWQICFQYENSNFFQHKDVQEIFRKTQALDYLDKFFMDEVNQSNYENSYHVFLYIKSFILDSLTQGSWNDEEIQNLCFLYQNFSKKQEIIKRDFSNIAEELLSERNCVPNGLLSVFNNGLTRAVHKKHGAPFSRSQMDFIDAISFGCSLENLENQNYEQAKQLIYIPKN